MNRFYFRKFLNRPGHHAGAYVFAFVERSLPSDDPGHTVEIEFEITDCFRHISLEFPMWTARERANSARKARLLADVLAGFAEAVEAEAAIAAERTKGRPTRQRD